MTVPPEMSLCATLKLTMPKLVEAEWSLPIKERDG